MEANVDSRYRPPESFKPLVKAAPLLDEAFSEGKELWLIQLPSNELKPEDMANKSWNMRLEPKDGLLGHFHSSRGHEILAIKQDCSIDNPRFAFLPTVNGSFSVRQITRQASFTCWPEIETTKGVAVSQETAEKAMITPEKKDLIWETLSSKRSGISTTSEKSVENQEQSERTNSHSHSIKKFTFDHDTISDKTDKDGEVTFHAVEHFSRGVQDNYQTTDGRLPMQKLSREKFMEVPSNLLDESPPQLANQQSVEDTVNTRKVRTPEGKEHSHKKKKKHHEHSSAVTPSVEKPSRENMREVQSNLMEESPPPQVNRAVEGTVHKRKDMTREVEERPHKKKKKHIERSQSIDVKPSLLEPSIKEVMQSPSNVVVVARPLAANQDPFQGTINEKEVTSERTEHSHTKKRKKIASRNLFDI